MKTNVPTPLFFFFFFNPVIVAREKKEKHELKKKLFNIYTSIFSLRADLARLH